MGFLSRLSGGSEAIPSFALIIGGTLFWVVGDSQDAAEWVTDPDATPLVFDTVGGDEILVRPEFVAGVYSYA